MILQQYPIPARKAGAIGGMGKKTGILHMCVEVWSTHVHKTTDTIKLAETLECTASGVEVAEAAARCSGVQMKPEKITSVLNKHSGEKLSLAMYFLRLLL